MILKDLRTIDSKKKQLLGWCIQLFVIHNLYIILILQILLLILFVCFWIQPIANDFLLSLFLFLVFVVVEACNSPFTSAFFQKFQ